MRKCYGWPAHVQGQASAFTLPSWSVRRARVPEARALNGRRSVSARTLTRRRVRSDDLYREMRGYEKGLKSGAESYGELSGKVAYFARRHGKAILLGLAAAILIAGRG